MFATSYRSCPSGMAVARRRAQPVLAMRRRFPRFGDVGENGVGTSAIPVDGIIRKPEAVAMSAAQECGHRPCVRPADQLGPDHAGRYLASFAWRYNRRYQLKTMIPRFVHSAARTEPMPYRLLIAG